MKPYKCPICNGKGIVSGGFYKSVNEYCSTTNVTETCQQCGGCGIIWGNEDSLEPCDECAPKENPFLCSNYPHNFVVVKNGLYYHDTEYGWEGIEINYCPWCGRKLSKDKED